MSESSRLDDLRRRVQKDPASIAFAHLAEECRRDGQFDEAVTVCRAGLAQHPGYLSARVTLGRALLALGRLDEAQHELQSVRIVASDNLLAVRSLADLFHRRGDLAGALAHYQQALALAPDDPELQRTVPEVTRAVAEATTAPGHLGASAAAAQNEHDTQPGESVAPPAASLLPLPPSERPQATGVLANDDLERQQALRTIAALEQWLTALNGPGAERHA